MATVDFWYEFASTYSYPAAMRIEALAADARRRRSPGARSCSGRCSPIRAGAIRRSTSIPSRAATCGATWSASATRSACRCGGPTRSRRTASSPRASRSRSKGRAAPPSRAPSTAPNSPKAGRSTTPATLAAALNEIGVEPEAALARAQDGANKERLKAECAHAKSLGLPGAPCLVAEDGEVFWGNDRLEQGLDWAVARPARRETEAKEPKMKFADSR